MPVQPGKITTWPPAKFAGNVLEVCSIWIRVNSSSVFSAAAYSFRHTHCHNSSGQTNFWILGKHQRCVSNSYSDICPIYSSADLSTNTVRHLLNTGNEFPNLANAFTTALMEKVQRVQSPLIEVSSHCYFLMSWARNVFFFYVTNMRTHFWHWGHLIVLFEEDLRVKNTLSVNLCLCKGSSWHHTVI